MISIERPLAQTVNNETVNQSRSVDEITEYQDSRWVSSTEAFWHIFGFSMHSNSPAVQRLPIHLENSQTSGNA